MIPYKQLSLADIFISVVYIPEAVYRELTENETFFKK